MRHTTTTELLGAGRPYPDILNKLSQEAVLSVQKLLTASK